MVNSPALEIDYPYVYSDGEFHACDRTVETTEVKVSSWSFVEPKNVEQMKAALA